MNKGWYVLKGFGMGETNFVPRFLRIHKARIGKHWVWPEHTNRETELVLINKGRMRCTIDGYEFVAQDGDVYFIQPDQLHYEEIVSEHIDIFTLRFDLLDGQGRSRRFMPDCRGRAQHLVGFAGESEELFEKILQLVWNERPGTERKIEELILNIIRLIRKTLEQTAGQLKPDRPLSRRNIFVGQAIEFMKANLKSNVSVGQIAKHCCVSPSHFTHVFKETMGSTPSSYLQQLRMDQAKRLLGDETLCVYEVAGKMGFSDAYYFSRMFKKVTGLSPQAFRSHIRRSYL